jgi:hypothetical protein
MMPGTIDFGGHSLGKDGAEYSFLVGALARAFAIRGISVAETGAVSGLPSIEAQKKDLYLPATEAATFPVAV